MKLISLTKGFFAQVDDSDFDYLNSTKWSVAEMFNTDGSIKNRYAVRTIRNNGIKRTQRMHCFIMGLTGLDHKDHNGLNNQRDNLRPATQAQQNSNRRKHILGKSKFKGVEPEVSGSYRVRIQHNGVRKFVGRFSSELEAAKAYDVAGKQLFGEFCFPNINEVTGDGK